MKVILKENVYKHGVAGDVVTVADGFARNYLIPRGLAVRANAGALRDNQHLLAQAGQRRAELRSRESEAAAQIDGVELVFGVKAGKNGKLYGSITTMDIAQALMEKTGVDINRRRISERPLRELGAHEVPVRMSGDLSPMLKVVILRDEDVEAYLAGDSVESIESQDEAEQIPEAEPVAEEEVSASETADALPAAEDEETAS
ncbi:MAG TPA: 50S ribosomal protein L9 [Aggregatilinea sp.]|jgi:large subunit ribosomal protein L9|uniref:50S ribosomal protein L9 n=1 Tax=Aggregatilinea sp. TaxID=2806333 RepID=UPI002CDC6B9E|nr:50S ribosomal protein L9 [Aggregatilinea sp.]HML22908.1 50S ribosomal protein L9 [Aggregatilinea sp.]